MRYTYKILYILSRSVCLPLSVNTDTPRQRTNNVAFGAVTDGGVGVLWGGAQQPNPPACGHPLCKGGITAARQAAFEAGRLGLTHTRGTRARAGRWFKRGRLNQCEGSRDMRMDLMTSFPSEICVKTGSCQFYVNRSMPLGIILS